MASSLAAALKFPRITVLLPRPSPPLAFFAPSLSAFRAGKTAMDTQTKHSAARAADRMASCLLLPCPSKVFLSGGDSGANRSSGNCKDDWKPPWTCVVSVLKSLPSRAFRRICESVALTSPKELSPRRRPSAFCAASRFAFTPESSHLLVKVRFRGAIVTEYRTVSLDSCSLLSKTHVINGVLSPGFGLKRCCNSKSNCTTAILSEIGWPSAEDSPPRAASGNNRRLQSG
mmetsp:Transcript_99350/g.289956  ORF Transcript_99350/g.289956 Transcript_99350/m.289956 type:complete len:230 (-) Transcript_99350:183-872(-)